MAPFLLEVLSCKNWCAPRVNIKASTVFCISKLNDLPSVVDYVQINMYADDTELHCCGKNLLHVQDNFQFDLIIRFSTGYKQKGYN